MLVSGVRSSCETLAMNSSLARTTSRSASNRVSKLKFRGTQLPARDEAIGENRRSRDQKCEHVPGKGGHGAGERVGVTEDGSRPGADHAHGVTQLLESDLRLPRQEGSCLLYPSLTQPTRHVCRRSHDPASCHL